MPAARTLPLAGVREVGAETFWLRFPEPAGAACDPGQFFMIAPALAVILGWLVLGEEVSARKWVAIALILTGVVLLTSTRKGQEGGRGETHVVDGRTE